MLEVETPVLGRGAVSDPQIESLVTQVSGMKGPFYLGTSPEFPMKRLLAAGSGDIYQLCRVFRDAEHGRWHNPEFTLLEWYRLGFDDAALMAEVETLVALLLAPKRRLAPAERLTYTEALGGMPEWMRTRPATPNSSVRPQITASCARPNWTATPSLTS